MTDGEQHVHQWGRDREPCRCGEPVPAYLAAAWDRYAERAEGDGQ